ncbi:MAG: molybdopterin molybdenumtransferase MoeA, partial [Cyclobacteriaceae bacterium]|nr:molybdopterin molybdenumtransferase MoeA [Cyclobacteriaceae bacterium]
MISVEEAKNLLQQHQLSGKTGTVALDDSLGLFLSTDIQSPVDIPFFDNSAMDGYAIRWKDGKSNRKLRTETKIRAGEMGNFILGEDEAIRIFTGAPIPNGADTVIQQELTNIEGSLFKFDIEKFERGANVRKKGAQNT